MLCVSPEIHADKVIVKNGDRLTGTVVRKNRTGLRLRTRYAGVLNIAWDRVLEVHTDRPVRVVLDDGTEHLTQVIRLEANKIVLSQPDNTEKMREFADRTVASINRRTQVSRRGQFYGRIDLGLKADRGNGDTDDFHLDLDMTYRKRHQRFRFLGEWDYETTKLGLRKKQGTIAGNYKYFFDKKLFGSLWLRVDRDELSDIDMRTTIGPFVGYEFYETPRLKFLVEGGFVWVNENRELDLDLDYAQPAWHLDFEKLLLKDALEVYHEQFGLIKADDKWLFDSRTGLRFPISGGFLGSVEIKMQYDSDPAEGVDTTETQYRFKLGYRW